MPFKTRREKLADIKARHAKAQRAKNVLGGIGSVIDLGIDKKIPQYSVKQYVNTNTPKKRSIVSEGSVLKITDLMAIDRAVVSGGKVLFEGDAKDGSIAVRLQKVKPGERILVRGQLTAGGQLKDVVLVSGSKGVSALSSRQIIRPIQIEHQ